MHHAHPAARIECDGDNINPPFDPITKVVRRKVTVGGTDQPLLLARADGLSRQSGVGAAGTYFGKHQRGRIAQHQVDLAAGVAPAAYQHPVARAFEIRRRHLLAAQPERTTLIGHDYG